MPALTRCAVLPPPGDGTACPDAMVAAGALERAGDAVALSSCAGQYPGGQYTGDQRPGGRWRGEQHLGGQWPGRMAAAPGGGWWDGPVRLFTGTYPGTPDQARRARADLAGALAGCPAADDVLICLAEIAANAVVHTRSGAPGGHFRVRADARPGQWVQVAVEDDGGPWLGRPAGDRAGHGHGLQIVRALSDQMGITGGGRGRTVWFRCPWHPA
jgi:serine/threonine-protein kinase RsbW